MNENVIRDKLANQLSTFFPELELIKTEYFLPKTDGTRGFIDILARSDKGNYVIIELKRSDNSARQAIHELIKYTEGLKNKLDLKESEIELYLISTEWNELLIPFSSFKEKANYTVSGYKLMIDGGRLMDCQSVQAIALAGDRLFSPFQTCRHYSSKDKLEIGLQEHILINQERGLNNYALIVLKSPEIDKAILADYISHLTNEAINAGNLESSNNQIITPDKLHDSKYVIYQSYLRSTKEHYLELLSEDQELLKESIENIEDDNLNDEEALQYFEEQALMNIGRYPETEFAEMGYPSKFKSMIIEQGFEVCQINAYGTLEENELISNELILDEFQGLTGIEKVLFKGQTNSESKLKIDEFSQKSMQCLENNPVWKGHVKHFIESVKQENNNFNLNVTVFNPFNILISLFRYLKHQTKEFMPFYGLNVDYESETIPNKIFYGVLKWNGVECPTLDSIIERYFDGDEFKLVAPILWGGDIENNLDVLKCMGLSYSSILVEHKNDVQHSKKVFQDFEFDLIREDEFFTIYDFVETNIELLANLSNIIESHSIGVNNEIVFNVKKDTPDNNM
jgi:hypothetical protein